MKKFNYLLFSGLTVMVVYTVFAVQNRVSVPVRLTFTEPAVYSLPVVVLISFIGGAVFSGILFFIYYLSSAGFKRPDLKILPNCPEKEDNSLEDEDGIPDLDERIRKQIRNVLEDTREASL